MSEQPSWLESLAMNALEVMLFLYVSVFMALVVFAFFWGMKSILGMFMEPRASETWATASTAAAFVILVVYWIHHETSRRGE